MGGAFGSGDLRGTAGDRRAASAGTQPYHPSPMDTGRHENKASHEAVPSPPRVCVVVSRYNDTVTGPMRRAAIETYRTRFGDAQGTVLGMVDAPGTYELTALATAAIECGLYDGVVALGCVIRGETDHDRYISQAVATGLTELTIQTGIPVAFGVITANTPEQATARAGGAKGNKGAEAMDAVLSAIFGIRHLYESAANGIAANYSLNQPSTDKAARDSTAGSA